MYCLPVLMSDVWLLTASFERWKRPDCNMQRVTNDHKSPNLINTGMGCSWLLLVCYNFNCQGEPGTCIRHEMQNLCNYLFLEWNETSLVIAELSPVLKDVLNHAGRGISPLWCHKRPRYLSQVIDDRHPGKGIFWPTCPFFQKWGS